MNEHSFSLPAWGVSLALHAGLVWLAVLFTAQVKPVLVEEIFKWNVALVEPANTDSPSGAMPHTAPESLEQAVPTVQPPARVATPRPVESRDAVTHKVAPQQTVQMVHPEVQPQKPVEQQVERIEQIVETPKPRPESVMPAQEPEPLPPPEPAVAQRQPEMSPPSEVRETHPVETSAKPSVPETIASSAPAELAPAITAPLSPGPQEAPAQVAKTAPSAPEERTDHRWLAESLWRRVAELKRYPSSARLNGQEGKVVLKAIIRSDGHLAEVTVQKSSGHQILDAAAIEAVKLACPLHMKHAIGKPEIIVSLPIVYSLAN